jgi:hypothetical protein
MKSDALLSLPHNAFGEGGCGVGEDPLFFYSWRRIYPLTTLEMHKKHFREMLKG